MIASLMTVYLIDESPPGFRPFQRCASMAPAHSQAALTRVQLKTGTSWINALIFMCLGAVSNMRVPLTVAAVWISNADGLAALSPQLSFSAPGSCMSRFRYDL